MRKLGALLIYIGLLIILVLLGIKVAEGGIMVLCLYIASVMIFIGVYLNFKYYD